MKVIVCVLNSTLVFSVAHVSSSSLPIVQFCFVLSPSLSFGDRSFFLRDGGGGGGGGGTRKKKEKKRGSSEKKAMKKWYNFFIN